ncbi:NADP-dependent oxidoreductase domain-containing protein [Dactylonectria estremocensis]|uniref:NADP-dependent oxidoreductase domain-containing protein n=1 Tax=Dactylonectria estremocensis TaxID=1079267 RepID=A0A9P9JEE1_9HYPO|nr:NADP-dependent oxidoreductase domain-containing protein [Dactylonectria estremocensis]
MSWPSSILALDRRISLPNSAASIPQLGFGVYKLRGDSCVQACLDALAAGYRHIDSADLYLNSHLVRDAVRRSGLDRESVFLTTKIGSPRPRRGRDAGSGSVAGVVGDGDDVVYQSAKDSVARIAGDDENGYVDLLLIHVPGPSREHRKSLWNTLERLRAQEKARSIGVSNFGVRHLEEMREYATVWPPSVNQIELHPWCQQHELVSYCNTHGIVIQAYSPLATGARLNDPTLRIIASKHGKTPAQVLVRYALQKNWIPLPKSAQADRIRENADVFGFVLDEGDMTMLDALDEGVKGARFPVNMT